MKEDGIGSTVDIRNLEGYSVLDRDNRKIGSVDGAWEDDSGQPAFISVKTGWLGMGRSHFIPVYDADLSESGHAIRLPYDEETVKNSPDFASESDIDAGRESSLYEYYRTRGKGTLEQPTADWRAGKAAPEDSGSIELKEETLNVGKRMVDSGGVRLRRVVRTETVSQPVELAHEEIVVERVRPAEGGKPSNGEFREDEIFIPLRREVADVSKSARVTEEVRARKKTETERENISETVRKEDIEIDRDEDASKRT